MGDFFCGVMGAIDVIAGVILLATGISMVMVVGGIMVGKGIMSFF